MNSLKRFLKKLTIILIVFSVVGGGLFLAFRPKVNSCFNGIQDNSETGIDCGGLCDKACPYPGKPDYVKDLRVNWVKFVEDGRNKYDFVANISNENESWGVLNMAYKFTYYDESGDMIGEKTGTSYMMPKGSLNKDPLVKYIVHENVESNIPVDRVEIILSDIKWEDVESEHDLENLNGDVIKVLNAHFDMNKSLNVYEGGGISNNSSIYDFVQVDFSVLIWGEGDELLAAGKTNQNTLRSGDGWGFTSLFDNFKSGIASVKKVECRADTNVFDRNNFMKEYRGKE